jgi:hypothetical protein
MYTETKRSIQERKNIQIVMMSKEELYKLEGAIAQTKAIAKEIDELQIDLHNGKIDLDDFYHLIILFKDDLETITKSYEKKLKQHSRLDTVLG